MHVGFFTEDDLIGRGEPDRQIVHVRQFHGFSMISGNALVPADPKKYPTLNSWVCSRPEHARSQHHGNSF
jgi:hypothetical protein